MTDETKLERFGKYLLLDHLVDGGMAKICRARYLGEEADKLVAIKMVQPQYSKDEAFQKMFMDEIKVAFGLLHSNIAQTYDYGMQNDQLYTAMELVDGRNLKEYIDKLKDKKYVFPVPVAVYVISQASIGLHYAHTLTDKLTGKAQKIVHRDISPHNIMLTFDGGVKVIDFGIAKAETNSDATQAGTIKGKLSYLAPEYLDGKDLDPRYDEFALGITLWEMLTTRKLFKAKNELAVLKQIQACKIPPPSTINPHVPKELDEIVMKALSKDRDDRYENCDQFNRALVKFLYSFNPDFNPMDLQKFARAIFKDEIKKDREKFFEFGKIDMTPYLKELKEEAEGKVVEVQVPGAAAGEEVAKKTENQVFDFGFEEEPDKALFNKTKTSADKDKSLSMEKTSLKKNLKSSRPNLNKTGINRNITRTSTKRGTRLTSVTEIENESQKSGAGKQILAIIVLLVSGFFVYQTFEKDINSLLGRNKVVAPVAPVDSELDDEDDDLGNVFDDDKVSAGMGKLIFSNFDRKNQKLFVNGKSYDVSVLGEVEIPLSNEVVLRVQEWRKKHFVTKFSLNSDSPRKQLDIPTMSKAYYGYLNMSMGCVTGKMTFTLFGEDRVERLPIHNKRGIAFPLNMSAEGQPSPQEYEVYYNSSLEPTIQRKAVFTISQEDETVDFCESISKYN